ncbi:hypothetical protein A35E_00236 [secondary endosymbiont of Heteropsylla cubana]|uniref:Uncharacterized protein n=1 Tax=secondary endosymbiont of Heteropsylla cubana TaxID=134287 RepID=J3TYQ4_9ENTR|nr:hypothetical protein [secondary endosymbiont of Heteropsylla cubana]AFP85545.1 hypothetical protein A35E_00236 [secondary endosymbiont of Heteropsylla cubana]
MKKSISVIMRYWFGDMVAWGAWYFINVWNQNMKCEKDYYLVKKDFKYNQIKLYDLVA